MQFVLMIFQGTTPLPSDPEAWATLSEAEQKQVWVDYSALNQTPGVTPGLPLGLPNNAKTVRVENDKPVVTNGTYSDVKDAAGGYLVYEADDFEAAIELASRIPAARLGGAVEVRPVEEYWK